MKKGISLHLGLNYVDPKHYDGWDGELAACEADANDMTALARARGFKPQKLLRKQVTAKAVKAAITKAAKSLKKGDIFFLTYSGHGGQVPDTNGDEGRFGDTADGKDETWCLYDRELIDDELAALYAQFKAGVRIVVLSDSCHSGSVTRGGNERRPAGRVRLLPRAQAEAVYEKNKALYDAIQAGLTGAEQQEVKATVLLISGCQDRQLSRDGDRNGAFTGALLKVWAEGAFTGGYKNFRDRISAEMNNDDQIPNYFVIGATNLAFENEPPFTVALKRGGTPAKKIKPATRKAPAKAQTPLEIVVGVLTHYGYPNPQASSPLTQWFKRLAKEDDATAVPPPGRPGLIAATLNERLGVGMTPSKMLAGHYPTPQDIADLA